jgi:hypothetical protein
VDVGDKFISASMILSILSNIQTKRSTKPIIIVSALYFEHASLGPNIARIEAVYRPLKTRQERDKMSWNLMRYPRLKELSRVMYL